VGLVFSWAWFCANRGSKQWQENWENHVDFLEDGVNGPLYKTIIRRSEASGLIKKAEGFLWGSKNFSVSKINQIVSLFVALIWILLIVKVLLPLDLSIADLDWFRTSVLVLTGLACLLILFSTTDQKNKQVQAWRRRSFIEDPASTVQRDPRNSSN
jgi:hypothetical protein